ncbi:hypothetical protein LCGC14_2210810 [marine sediment metagenome]|uniref:Uncharacterized protein n=1 Tax=marine sediment metagenome TaxID=412755 RepID=A0A0F9E1B4_9ZZZZ
MNSTKELEFRIKYMFYDGDLQYYIEQYRKDKWRLVAGGFTRSEAERILEEGEGEMLVKTMSRIKIFVVSLTILAIMYLIINWLII